MCPKPQVTYNGKRLSAGTDYVWEGAGAAAGFFRAGMASYKIKR